MEKTTSKQQIVYGIRPVLEALASGAQVERVLMQNGLNSSLLNELRTKMKERDVPFQYVPVEKLNKMTTGNHQGVVATLASIKYANFMELGEREEAPRHRECRLSGWVHDQQHLHDRRCRCGPELPHHELQLEPHLRQLLQLGRV